MVKGSITQAMDWFLIGLRALQLRVPRGIRERESESERERD